MTNAERAYRLWPVLVLAARSRHTLTHRVLRDLTGINERHLDTALGFIDVYCSTHNLPRLSTVVAIDAREFQGTGTELFDRLREQARVLEFDWLSRTAPAFAGFTPPASAMRAIGTWVIDDPFARRRIDGDREYRCVVLRIPDDATTLPLSTAEQQAAHLAELLTRESSGGWTLAWLLPGSRQPSRSETRGYAIFSRPYVAEPETTSPDADVSANDVSDIMQILGFSGTEPTSEDRSSDGDVAEPENAETPIDASSTSLQ